MSKWKKFSVSHQNNVPVLDIARFYLDQIKANNITILNFHPLGKNSTAMSNRFRLAVLKHLTHNNCYQAHTDKRELEIATEAAIKAGYTINEVDSADYDTKRYLSDVKHEAQQVQSSVAA